MAANGELWAPASRLRTPHGSHLNVRCLHLNLKHFGGFSDSCFDIQFGIVDEADAAVGRCKSFVRTSLNTQYNYFYPRVFLFNH